MKNLSRILAKVYQEPWLITAAKHRAMQRVLESHLAGTKHAGPVIQDDEEEDDEEEMIVDAGVAMIPVHGIIGKHLSSLEMSSGGADLDTVSAMVDGAMTDPAVHTMLFDFRTPGGTVTGVPELARKIGNITSKDTIAFTDSECCSAGYWLASQCAKFYVTESADVGSVGVYMAWLDESRALENEGYKVNAIAAGKYKLSGASFKPLTAEERAIFQAQVDKTYDQFKTAILGKRQIDDEFLEGQVFDGLEAVENGLADGIVEDITEALS